MAWLRNKKTGGWFEIPDDKLDTNKYMNSFIRQKTNNCKKNSFRQICGKNSFCSDDCNCAPACVCTFF